MDKGIFLRTLLPLAVAMVAALLLGAYLSSPAASQLFVDTCPTGPYRIEAFQYKSGAGFVQLVGGSGTVLGRSEFSESAMVRPRWSQDCRTVSFGSDTDPAPLAARP